MTNDHTTNNEINSTDHFGYFYLYTWKRVRHENGFCQT
jgi:hypothetical protein